MKKLSFGLAALVAGLLTGSAAQASQFSFNYCPGNASCPADLTEASITFTTLDLTPDVNDYTATVTFKGTLTTAYIDQIDFTAGMDFASKPTLTATGAPAGTVVADWSIFYDKVDNGQGCASDKNNQAFACAIDTKVGGNGPDFAGTNTWVFNVDFAGNGVIGSNSDVNLRALFVDAQGNKIFSILSPNGNEVTTTTTATPTTTGQETTTGTTVPEPALLSMLGIGLAGAAYRARRRS